MSKGKDELYRVRSALSEDKGYELHACNRHLIRQNSELEEENRLLREENEMLKGLIKRLREMEEVVVDINDKVNDEQGPRREQGKQSHD